MVNWSRVQRLTRLCKSFILFSEWRTESSSGVIKLLSPVSSLLSGEVSFLGKLFWTNFFGKTSLDSNWIIYAVLFGAASRVEMICSSFVCINLMAICMHTRAAAFAVSLRWMWTATSSDKRYADEERLLMQATHPAYQVFISPRAALPITWCLHKPPAIKMCALFASS